MTSFEPWQHTVISLIRLLANEELIWLLLLPTNPQCGELIIFPLIVTQKDLLKKRAAEIFIN